jgi:hypothetical protein
MSEAFGAGHFRCEVARVVSRGWAIGSKVGVDATAADGPSSLERAIVFAAKARLPVVFSQIFGLYSQQHRHGINGY